MTEAIAETTLQMRSPVEAGGGAMAKAMQTREMAEVQCAVVMAKQFPRDEQRSLDRILNACTRPSLAEGSTYDYAKGGTTITGPSIRLAECIAQNWGNIQFGIRELSQDNGVSEVEAFAWDMETLARQVKTFQVRHVRYTRKGGNKDLHDPREIYETVANQGARRLRACILGIIPGDVVEAAVDQCEVTLAAKAEVTPERIKEMLEKFEDYEVTKGHIEKRIQRRIDTMKPAQMLQLGKIYTSLSDGMSNPSDWFEIGLQAQAQETGVKVSQKQLAIEAAKEAGCYVEEMEEQNAGAIRDAIDAHKNTPPKTDRPETKGEQHTRIANAATKVVKAEEKGAGDAEPETAEAPPVDAAEAQPITDELMATLQDIVDEGRIPGGPVKRAKAETGVDEDAEIGTLTQDQGMALKSRLDRLLADIEADGGPTDPTDGEEHTQSAS